MRQPGQAALVDDFRLAEHFSQELADARPQRREREARRGAGAANDQEHFAETQPEQRERDDEEC